MYSRHNACVYIYILWIHVYMYIHTYIYVYIYICIHPYGSRYFLSRDWLSSMISPPQIIARSYLKKVQLDPVHHGYAEVFGSTRIYIYDMYMYVDVDVYIYIHMCIHTHCMFIYIYWYAHTDHFWLGLIVTFLHTAWWRSPMFTFNIWPTSTQDGSDDIVFEVIDYSHSRSVSDSMYICSNTISSARVSQTSRLYPYKVRPQTIDQLVCSLHS